mmetsp:Transcript_11172/g.18253  ORF Transcript_11172/g.18253 Transcript_11172/m.18253 type:complete len:246 (-) Transcript_11172:1099-1836(-)
MVSRRTVQLGFRLCACIWLTFVQISCIATNGIWVYFFFSTDCLNLLAVFFALAALASYKPHLTKSNSQSIDGLFPQEREELTAFGRAVVVVYELNCTYALFLSIVFWSFLFKQLVPLIAGKPFQWFIMSQQHVFNVVFCIIETAIGDLPFFVRDVWWMLFGLTTYLIGAFLIKLERDMWIYPFLDISKPIAAVFYIGLFVLSVTCYFLWFGVIRLRTAFGRRGTAFDLNQTGDTNYLELKQSDLV